jgi:hypothetical protein
VGERLNGLALVNINKNEQLSEGEINKIIFKKGIQKNAIR